MLCVTLDRCQATTGDGFDDAMVAGHNVLRQKLADQTVIIGNQYAHKLGEEIDQAAGSSAMRT